MTELSVVCPMCGALPLRPCRTSVGRLTEGRRPHRSRVLAEAGVRRKMLPEDFAVALTIVCPRCRAAVGMYCFHANGQPMKSNSERVHRSRWFKASGCGAWAKGEK